MTIANRLKGGVAVRSLERPSRRVVTAACLLLTLIIGWRGDATAVQLSLAWVDSSTNEAGFAIERSTGTTATFGEIATTGPGDPGYTDLSVAGGTTYCYRVRAFNAMAYSAYSNSACATVAQTASVAVLKVGAGSGTVTSSPAGIVCGASCSASYASGTVVTLTAAPAAGSTFTGWSGACTGAGSCTVTMSAAVVTASFDQTTPVGLPMPNLALALNRESYSTGATFSATVAEENAGDASIVVDKYFGVLLSASASSLVPCPGADGIVFLSPMVLTCLSLPATFMPYEQNVLLPARLLATTPSFLEFVWPPAPSGTYVFFIVYTRPGTLEVIAVATRSVSFTP